MVSSKNRYSKTKGKSLILTDFGNLKVLDFYEGPPPKYSPRFICLCRKCGSFCSKSAWNIKFKKCCGCISYANSSERRKKTHKWSNGKALPELNVWYGMLCRCFKKHDKGYRHYGGRGITVCDRWKNSFEAFLEDMGRRPTEDGIRFSIERIDNNGNYCPENCKWATYLEQQSNRRSNVYIEVNGIRKCVRDWCRYLGWPLHRLDIHRLKGKTREEIVSQAFLEHQSSLGL